MQSLEFEHRSRHYVSSGAPDAGAGAPLYAPGLLTNYHTTTFPLQLADAGDSLWRGHGAETAPGFYSSEYKHESVSMDNLGQAGGLIAGESHLPHSCAVDAAHLRLSAVNNVGACGGSSTAKLPPTEHYCSTTGSCMQQQHQCSCGTSYATTSRFPAEEPPQQPLNTGVSEQNPAFPCGETLEEDSMGYEYYIWDPVAGEYVPTDQQTGQRMLEDPQFDQYHYRLVENTIEGETTLVPDDGEGQLDPLGVDPLGVCDPTYGATDRALDPNANAGQEQAAATSVPFVALSTPRLVSAQPQGSTQVIGNVLGPAATTHTCARKCHSDYHEKENHQLYATASTMCPTAHKPTASQSSAVPCIHGFARENQLRQPASARGLASHALPAHTLASSRTAPLACKTHYPLSYSRPWGCTGFALGGREHQLRHLRHLQRVQELEREELRKRQTFLGQITASVQRASRGVELEALKQPRAPKQTAKSSVPVSRVPYRGLSRGSGAAGGSTAARCDPVARGQYFRSKWKNDRFLEQQKHPAFDVKAYDAWLRSSGHLLRARALQLQQEEQKLVSMLQEQTLRSARKR